MKIASSIKILKFPDFSRILDKKVKFPDFSPIFWSNIKFPEFSRLRSNPGITTKKYFHTSTCFNVHMLIWPLTSSFFCFWSHTSKRLCIPVINQWKESKSNFYFSYLSVVLKVKICKTFFLSNMNASNILPYNCFRNLLIQVVNKT